jgi:DNA gyrase inhibitor GyrI
VNDKHICQGNIAGGRYAVFTISHTAEAVQKAWLEIFPELLKQGSQFDETRPILERYIVEMVNNHLCEICVPIK